MSFLLTKKNGGPSAQPGHYCKMHSQRIVQLGNCLTCNSSCGICEVKGCIKSHSENQRIHNIVTVQYVRHVINQFLNSGQTKRQYLKKMIADYFMAAKQQLEILFEKIHASVEQFEFDSIIFMEDQKGIIGQILKQEYNQLSCTDIAVVLPKLIKANNFQDGHFAHLRDYVKKQLESIPKLFDNMILNIPYFRNFRNKKQKQYCEIASEVLADVNEQIKKISFRPKKICIKYSKLLIQHSLGYYYLIFRIKMMKNQEYIYNNLEKFYQKSMYQYQIGFNLKFLTLLWDVHQEDFQIAFFEALCRFPYLKQVNIHTAYRVTNTQWIDQIIDEGTVDVRIYKEQWAF